MSGSYYYDYCTAANSFFFFSGYPASLPSCVLCQAWRRRHHRRFIFIRTRKEVAPQRFFQFLFFFQTWKVDDGETGREKEKKISSRCAALVDWCHRRKKLFWNLCESQNKHIPVKMWKGKGNLITIDIIAQGKFNDTLLRRVDIQMRWMRVCVLAVFFSGACRNLKVVSNFWAAIFQQN